MIRLIIVDDEELTRDSLYEYIPWLELGVDEVQTAKNGLDALRIAENFYPDIILTDVRMPKMDGIELAERSRQLYPDCKIIFLSGYSDKEYLKSAIQLKALSYIDKPIKIEEIKTSVKDAVSLCLEEENKKNENDKLISRLVKSLPLIRQEIVLELIKENVDINALIEKYDTIFFNLSPDSCYRSCSIILNWKTNTDKDMIDSINKIILSMFSENTFDKPVNVLVGFSDLNSLILLINENSNYKEPDNSSFYNKILQKLICISEGLFSLSIGIGSTVKNIHRLSESYNHANIALSKHFYRGTNKIYYYNDIHSTNFHFDKDILVNFKNHLKKNNKESAKNIVTKLTQEIKSIEYADIIKVKNVFWELLIIFRDVAIERNLLEHSEDIGNQFLWQQIENISTLSELEELMLSHIESTFTLLDSKETSNRKIYEVMKHIQKNYFDRDLSIQSIANSVSLNHNYLCSFFKKTTGKTINEYITEVRIEMAKELLRDNKKKLYEIAISIGLTDANYFSTIFKKYEGCTPSEFREKYYL